MEKYITVFGLSVITLALIYVFTACSRVITSTPKLVTSTPSENNLYVLPKKILKTTTTYEVEEAFDDTNAFIKTMGCIVKEDVKIEAQMLPDYNKIFEIKNTNPSKFTLKLDYGSEGVGILSCLNAEVSPEIGEVISGVISVASQLSSSPLLLGTRTDKVVAKTVKRDVKIIQFIVPDKVPNLVTLKAPKFRDDYQPNGNVLINFASDIDDKQIPSSNNTSFNGIVYRLPIATQVDVLYGSNQDAPNAAQISSQIIYFPQFGPLQIVPMNLSYNMFSGKRTINVSFNTNTGGLTKVEMTRESATKAAFEGLKSNFQSVDKGVQDFKNKNTPQALLQTRLDELKKQKEINDLEKQIKDLETSNSKKN